MNNNITLSSSVEELIKTHDYKFLYQLLARLKQDCEYYLGYGNRQKKHLWALTEVDHIQAMKKIHNHFKIDEKPEWLTMQDILNYEKQILK